MPIVGVVQGGRLHWTQRKRLATSYGKSSWGTEGGKKVTETGALKGKGRGKGKTQLYGQGYLCGEWGCS